MSFRAVSGIICDNRFFCPKITLKECLPGLTEDHQQPPSHPSDDDFFFIFFNFFMYNDYRAVNICLGLLFAPCALFYIGGGCA